MLITEAIMKTFISCYYFIDHLIHHCKVREVVHSYISVSSSVSQLAMFTVVLIKGNAAMLIAVYFHVVSFSQCACVSLCLDSVLILS